MSDIYSEIEYKLPAEKVGVNEFVTWCASQGPDQYVHILSPDLYYAQGVSTIRHRWGDNGEAGELTVKRRKDSKSTTDRVEIDLFFNDKTTKEDVAKFLELTGWKRIFTIVKEAHIFNFKKNDAPDVSVVIYDCWLIDKPGSKRRFIEIEAAKGTRETLAKDKAIINEWYQKIASLFDVEPPCNKSLYEIYSGKKYKLV